MLAHRPDLLCAIWSRSGRGSRRWSDLYSRAMPT